MHHPPITPLSFTERQALKSGVPCPHRGCLQHLTHPCEMCGRIGGVSLALDAWRVYEGVPAGDILKAMLARITELEQYIVFLDKERHEQSIRSYYRGYPSTHDDDGFKPDRTGRL